MRLGYRARLLAILFSLSYSNAHANGHLQFAGDVDGNACEIADPGPNGLVDVYVLANGFNGVTGFHFSAPVPSSSGLQHVSDQSAYFMVGNSQTGIDVGVPFCQTSTSFVVMTIQFHKGAAGNACTYYTAQTGQLYSLYYNDCLFTALPIQATGVMLNSDGTCAQARPVAPADGATNVPLLTSLSWTSGYSCYLSGSTLVFFGTTPSPPQVAYDVTSPYIVGPLQPGTKYYWKVADPGAGPVWSFTTTNSVATTPSTWGSIKALYR
jgi:hypothetical protein